MLTLPFALPTGADGSEPSDEFIGVNPESEEPTGYKKFLTVGKGVLLFRFAGKDEIKFVARRKGVSGSPNAIFEIDVDKRERIGSITKDGKELFYIGGTGVNNSTLEKLCVSALHRWFKNQRPTRSKRRRARKLREEVAQ